MPLIPLMFQTSRIPLFRDIHVLESGIYDSNLRISTRKLTARQHVNAPLAGAAAVECDPAAIRRPGELLRRRIREHALHRAIGKVEKPAAVAEDLEDDLRAIRRDRGRPHQLP